MDIDSATLIVLPNWPPEAPGTVAAAILAVFLVILAIATTTDLRARIIPNVLTLWGTVALLLLRAADGWPPFAHGWSALLAGIEGMVLLSALMLAVHLISRGQLGLGDVKLCAVIGAALGPALGLAALLVGLLAGAAMGLVLVVTRLRGLRDHIPYGPALCAGGVVAAFWGSMLINWYLGT